MSGHSHSATAEDFVGPPHIHHMSSTNAYGAAKLGMWLFLATEVLLFGAMFTAFAIYRYLYPAEFHEASHHLKIWAGGINTAVLISSSFTAALAMDAAQHGNNARVRKLLLFTIGCGGIFLVIKFFEYRSKYFEGLFPVAHTSYGSVSLFYPVVVLGGFLLAFCALQAISYVSFHYHKYKNYMVLQAVSFALIGLYALVCIFAFDGLTNPEGAHYAWAGDTVASKYKMYFGLYYCMTGLHALHVIIGMGLLFWVFLLASKNRFSEDYYTPVEIGALYWHLVDLIWIYLFPLLYLID